MNLHDLQSRLIAMRQDLDAIGTAFGLLSKPIMKWRDNEIWLPPEFHDQLKTQLLAALDIIDGEADKAVALGGTIDSPTQAQTVLEPLYALDILNRAINELLELPKVSAVTQDNGNYQTSLPPDIEQDVLMKVSTVGVCLKLWVTWSRPQVVSL